MSNNFEKKSFKDFENIPGMDFYGWAQQWKAYVADRSSIGEFNYRQENQAGCNAEAELLLDGSPHRHFVNLTSNDYLGLTQHPLVMQAAKDGIDRYGTGAGSSPAIGGHYAYHREIEQGIARFFKREDAIRIFNWLFGQQRYAANRIEEGGSGHPRHGRARQRVRGLPAH